MYREHQLATIDTMIAFEESLLDIAREAQAKKQCLDKFSSEDLFLNNPSDPPVSVPKFAARLLKPHHSMGVIFLYHAVVEKVSLLNLTKFYNNLTEQLFWCY